MMKTLTREGKMMVTKGRKVMVTKGRKVMTRKAKRRIKTKIRKGRTGRERRRMMMISLVKSLENN